MADIDTLNRTRGESEEAMHRLSREMPGDETLAFALLARMVDELRAEVAALRADVPHIELTQPRQVLELWAERGFFPDAEGRLQELADDRHGPTLR